MLGVKESRIVKIIEVFNGKEDGIDRLVDASFLRYDVKQLYKQTYKDKLTRMKVIAKV